MDVSTKMRILVAIANYGFKQAECLKRLIREYQSMPCKVDIIILSNEPKKFEPGIEVIVGLPAKNPWSLPFGHKKIFSERLQDYDVFIYSEDDILITWKNILFFLQQTSVLPEETISGFLRYEEDSAGRKSFPDFVGPYHWLSKPVKKIGHYAFAEFSNAHSACYILTRDQLRRAINSGGYLVKPHEGRYDLLCSAATDPYTQCGFKKLICISHVSDVLVHHVSNKYVGRFGIDEDDFERQIAFMLSEYALKENQELFITEKNINHIRWDKVYFDVADEHLLSMVSPKSKNILSIGCGYPATEAALVKRKRTVTAIPLDPIVGTLALSRGITVTKSDIQKAFHDLEGMSFDCIILSDVLQHLNDPVDILSRAARLLTSDGEVLISVPNFRYLKYLKDHFPYPFFKKWTYAENFLHMVGKNHLIYLFRSIGVKDIDIHFTDLSQSLKRIRPSFGIFNVLFANRLLARGKKTL